MAQSWRKEKAGKLVETREAIGITRSELGEQTRSEVGEGALLSYSREEQTVKLVHTLLFVTVQFAD